MRRHGRGDRRIELDGLGVTAETRQRHDDAYALEQDVVRVGATYLADEGGKAGERLVPIKLGAKLTEVGTLEIWAESKTSEHRWRLQFELRKAAAAS